MPISAMLSPADIAALKAKAKADAEGALRQFILGAWRVVEPGTRFIPNWHIDAICEHLEAVYRGEIRNLLINMPPRCMKSLLVGVTFPAWVWTFDPFMRFLFASYSQSLSTRDSLKCRRIIESPWYQENWGGVFRMAGDQNQKTRFENDKAGYRLSTSVGGTATGEGGDIIGVDDPTSAEEALSTKQRETALIWWDETMSTRLNNPKTGRKIIVMQRLHEKDLSGHVLEKGGYVHLMLPMRFERERKCIIRVTGWEDPREKEGELLWVDRIDEKALADIERGLGSYATAGQHQQRPMPRGGGMFQRQWLKIVKASPAKARRVRFWDFAATEAAQGKDPDWTVGLKMAVADNGMIYIEDVRRIQGSPAAVEALVRQTAELDGYEIPIYIEQEGGSSGKAVISYYVRQVLAGWSVRGDSPQGQKAIRAEPLASQAEAGNVSLVESPWVEAYLSEVEVFPAGAHDDQVDASSGAYKQLVGKRKAEVF